MSFDLSIAAKRERAECDRADHASNMFSITVLFNGHMDEAAVDAISRTVDAEFDGRCASLLIEILKLTFEREALSKLAVVTMGMRRAGHDAQILVHDRSAYEAMAGLEGSRDWLIASPDVEVTGGRLSMHLDGPSNREARKISES